MIESFSILSGIILFFTTFKNKLVRNEYGLVLLIFIGIVLFDGLRWEMGTDWLNYLKNFENINQRFTPGMEIGFNYYVSFIASLTKNYSVYLLITSFLIYYGTIYKSYFISDKGFASIFIIISMLTWYSGGQRQMLACSIFILSIPYILERRFLMYFIFSMIGLSFHISYIILIPLYFLYGISHKKFIIINLIFIGLSFIFYQIILNLAFLFEIFNPGKDISERFNSSLQSNPILGFGRKIAVLAPLVFFYLRNEKIFYNRKVKFFFHMSLFSFTIYFLGYNYIGILASRLNIYFEILGIGLFLGSIQKKLISKQMKSIFILYCIFIVVLNYMLLADWGFNLFHPYSSIFYNYDLNRMLF